MSKRPEAHNPKRDAVPCTVYDRFEGKLHITVKGSHEAEAYDEASIAAAELGCTDLVEVVVGIHE